jgi:TPR repeat protein
LEGAACYFKLAADQGFADAQNNYGFCLRNGDGVPIDLEGSAYYFKLAADQGIEDAQSYYGICLFQGQGVSIDFQGAAHFFKLAADQGVAAAHFCSAICLITGDAVNRNLPFNQSLNLPTPQKSESATLKHFISLFNSRPFNI